MSATTPNPPESVTGVQLAQGIGHQPAKGFWADAWSQVLKRPAAVASIAWIAIVAVFAILAPFIASGHPLTQTIDGQTTSPLIDNLSSADVLLLIFGIITAAMMLPKRGAPRSKRGAALVLAAIQAGATVILTAAIRSWFERRSAPQFAQDAAAAAAFPYALPIAIASLLAILFLIASRPWQSFAARLAWVAMIAVVAAGVISFKWTEPLERFDYREREAAGMIDATYTLIPFSPGQTSTSLFFEPPGTTLGEGLGERAAGRLPPEDAGKRFILGTDAQGQDVLTQMLHACRLSISIGLVSTSIAVVIGVTIGALMGYFGGWVDLLLYRVVEIFMAIPLLFLLIVAAGVLPRNTYVMMIIIGCVTWTGAARFTRAEFFKLRNQDFVQSARSVGLPLRSILFRHMLPNGVTPVLVDASFAIAAAILIEAILSFLGLGPVNQPSWGRLLSDSTNETGVFKWWLAIFPGAAIFLTVLAYNLIGEALRDAIDPKLKKARV